MALESLDITIARIMWAKPDKFKNGIDHVGARTTGGQMVKGNMTKAVIGERYRLWGTWQLQKPYGNFPAENAFIFETYEPVIDQSETGLAHYLRTYVDGLGIAKASAITSHFGMDTLKVLRETPDRAVEVQGITEKNIEQIKEHFSKNLTIDPAAYARLVDMFSGFKVPKRVINTLLQDFGSDAPTIVQDRPYLLLAFPRLGWKIVDSFATSEKIGYPHDGIERNKAAIVEALEQISNEGHTYGTEADIIGICYKLINARPTEAAWDAAIADGMIVRDVAGEEIIFALPKYYEAESRIAARLATLAETGKPLGFALSDDGLNEEQCAALRMIEENPVCAVTGAPGVGKTYLITRALAGLIKHGYRAITFVAPTGKAAKRANDLLNKALPNCPIVATTVHRALKPTPSSALMGVPTGSAKIGRGRNEFGFGHNADNPMMSNIYVCDETSMKDVCLGADFLDAIPNGARLIYVGDENQLPSVGPGSMLRDLLTGGLPHVTLTEIQRSAGDSVKACHAILKGEIPKPSTEFDMANGKNWAHIEVSEPAEILAKIVKLHAVCQEKWGIDPELDAQTIAPQYDKPGVGCNQLNAELSNLLNKFKSIGAGNAALSDEGFGPKYGPGDKVIRTKNGLCDLMLTPSQWAEAGKPESSPFIWDGDRYELIETDVVNGDMGMVREIVESGKEHHVIVSFLNPYRLCRLSLGDANLQLAYAITTHKAQGSGFPLVILPVHNSFFPGLWTREMFYTELSRIERGGITVGPFSAIRAAVGRHTVGRRKTRLSDLVASSFKREPELVAV